MKIEIIILFICACYAMGFVIILLKVKTGFSSDLLKDIDVNSIPKFSIIVAAKNESDNVQVIISALKNNNYPNDSYEVIIVDDNSTDNTFEIAKEFCSVIDNFSVVKAIDKIYNGKRGALDFGVSLAKHPNIIITDADCIPNENWINYCTLTVHNKCDFYFGIAPFIQRNNIVNKISCYENLSNSLLAIGAVKLNLPYTASARNFGFTKEAFDKIGGYSKTLDTISGDDDLLLREAVNNDLKICVLTHPGSLVYSESKSTFKEYILQRARHTQTSFYYSLKQKIFLSSWHILNITFTLSPILIFVNNLFLLPFLVKIILDITKTALYQKKFEYNFKMPEVIYLQILYELFSVVHFFKARFGKIEWK